jgi:hypothetical protein
MFSVLVPDRILVFANSQVSQFNFGRRAFGNGTREQQLVGVAGESVVREWFLQNPMDGRVGFDGGVDIRYLGLTIDVKVMGRTTDVRPDFVNNFVAAQAGFPTDVLVFCSYNKRTQMLTVCGWISKGEFLAKANLYPTGTLRFRADGTSFKTFADLYEISNTLLNDVTDVDDLKRQLSDFGGAA